VKRIMTLWSACSLALLFLMTATNGRCDTFSKEMFGIEQGYVHPFLSVSGEYTDNLFSDETGEESDFFTKVSPGIWLSLPGADAEVINYASSSSTPGGMAQTRFQAEDMGRYQTFLKYAPTFENYIDFNERDIVTHQLDAYAALNLSGGLSFELMDQYKDDRDSVEEQTDSAEYNNNLVGLTTSYNVTEKLKARVDVRYYDVNYDSTKPEKDREDMSVTGYVFFAVKPKTSVFAEVSHVDVDYDIAIKDSTELKVYGGVKYDASDRIDAMLKVGYISKDLDATDETKDSPSFEGTLWYDLTSRIDINASASRFTKESTTGRFSTETKGSVIGSYEATDKIKASLMLSVSEEDYDSLDRDDTTYTVSPSLNYALSPKVYGNLAYSYSEKDATGSESGASDYTKNSVIFTMSASF